MISIIPIGGAKRAVKTMLSLLKRKDVIIPYVIIMPGYANEHKYSDELAKIVKSNNIEYALLDKIDTKTENLCRQLNPDAYIGIGIWRSVINESFLSTSKYGFYALHGTPLPKYRGWAGINWQIINGETELRMRPLRLGNGVDDGDLLCDRHMKPIEYAISLKNENHLEEIFKDYECLHIKAVNDIIDRLLLGNLYLIPQNASDATYCCQRGPEDAMIKWDAPAAVVFNFIRAQSKPYSGAYTYFKGKKTIIWRSRHRCEYKHYAGRIPGKVVERSKEAGSVIVLTSDAAVEVLEAEVADSGIFQTPYEIFNTVRDRCKTRTEAYCDSVGFL